MTISEALRLVRSADAHSRAYTVVLACGFTPLHLQTFLTAHLQKRLPNRKVSTTTGLYGDLLETIRQSTGTKAQALAIAIEWSDLDPRLGYRRLGGWGPNEETDIAATAQASLAQIQSAIEEAREHQLVVLSFPTLPFPPAFHACSWQAGKVQSALMSSMNRIGAELSGLENVLVVNSQQLAIESPLLSRFDLKSDLLTGLPYAVAHASVLGNALAHLIAPTSPKKGLVTDLDDTFWGGIVGEVGASNVSWDLANHTQLHGLYQQTLRALADQGVLVAIASKNDPAEVDRAFARDDLIMPKDKFFPLEVHWHAKSASVKRILEAWNIGEQDVVFVDDSPIELAEVTQVFPGIECLQFPKDNYKNAEGFLRRLRDLFAKPVLSAEDSLRRESLRKTAKIAGQLCDASDDFFKSLGAVVTLNRAAASDPRSLELVNKTNQFNLNGRRYDSAEWSEAAQREGGFVWSFSYQDKFGPLGTIAVVAGVQRPAETMVTSWVMSCRAFGRRIEHQCLHLLFERTQADHISFCAQATDRNRPSREFLNQYCGSDANGLIVITRRELEVRCPVLFHTILEKEA